MKCNPFLLPALIAIPACATLADQPRQQEVVDRGMIAHLSEDEQRAIRDAQVLEAKARDQVAAAQAATQQANYDLQVANQDLEVAEAELKKAELNVLAAEKGTTDDVNRAREAHDQALALPMAARARIALRERQIERAQARELLASERVDLAVATVELERAKAVKNLDRPDAQKIDLARFERDRRNAEVDVIVATVKLDAAAREAEIARNQYEGSIEAIPATYRDAWGDDFAEDRAKEALDLENQIRLDSVDSTHSIDSTNK